jgi:hypothetical protein
MIRKSVSKVGGARSTAGAGGPGGKSVALKGGAHGKASPGATLQIASNFWAKWIEVAAEHARAAQRARRRAYKAKKGSKAMGRAFNDELKASLVAITASAFAIDAWDKAVRSRIPGPRAGKGAADKIVRTLKRGFAVGAPAGRRWDKRVKELFDLRNDVVHHTSNFTEGGRIPLGYRTSHWKTPCTRPKKPFGRST